MCFFVLLLPVKPVVPRCSVPQSVPVGKSASLTCVETEGFPLPTYHWYRDNEPLPDNPKSSPKFFNSSYTADPKDGTLVWATSYTLCSAVNCRACIHGKSLNLVLND